MLNIEYTDEKKCVFCVLESYNHCSNSSKNNLNNFIELSEQFNNGRNTNPHLVKKNSKVVFVDRGKNLLEQSREVII